VSGTIASAPRARGATNGRTRITAHALEQVVSAVAGDALGVAARQVEAKLKDHAGSLDVTAHARIRVISIARLRDDPRSLERWGGSVLSRCARAEHQIRDRLQSLTGYTVHRVTIRLTDLEGHQEARVR
jgi:hypothetical protein